MYALVIAYLPPPLLILRRTTKSSIAEPRKFSENPGVKNKKGMNGLALNAAQDEDCAIEYAGTGRPHGVATLISAICTVFKNYNRKREGGLTITESHERLT